jgi:hypothetical protein
MAKLKAAAGEKVKINNSQLMTLAEALALLPPANQ